MKLYERHLAREIYASTALVGVAFLALFAFLDLIYELENIGKDGYQIQHALGYVALTLPGRLYELLPICVLIGTLHGLTVLARQSEITVLRAAGVATNEFLFSLARIGVVFVVITLMLGELVVPYAERTAQQLKLSVQGVMVAQEFRSGLWVKDGRAFINVGNVFPDASMENIHIFDFDENLRLNSISEAKVGRYLMEGQWLLQDVRRATFDGNTVRTLNTDELIWHTMLNPNFLSILSINPSRMSLFNLISYIQHLHGNQQKTNRYEIAFWKKIIYPLTELFMMMLALPFSYAPQERVATGNLQILIGIMLGVVFHMLNGLIYNFAIVNEWPSFFSAALPSLLLIFLVYVMLNWKRMH